jgi:hypothetical protein
MDSPRLSLAEQKAIEKDFDNTREAFALLDLIDAEFRSDPTSTACFDARIVERVRWCVANRRDFEKRFPWNA